MFISTKGVRIEITMLKMYFCAGKSEVLRQKFRFTAMRSRAVKRNLSRKTDDLPAQKYFFSMVISILTPFLLKKHYLLLYLCFFKV